MGYGDGLWDRYCVVGQFKYRTDFKGILIFNDPIIEKTFVRCQLSQKREEVGVLTY